MFRFQSLFGLILIASFSVSCSPFRSLNEENESGLETFDLGKAYRENSCEIPFEQGGEAPAFLPERSVVATFFGKKFDRSRLAAVGFASPKAISEFMFLDGVSAQSMPLVLPGACAALGSLPTASARAQEYWNEIAGGAVLGVYLPINRSKPLGENKPLILLRADTDRYTLVHEYLHHVFNDVREGDGERNEDLMNRLEALGLRYERVGPLPFGREGDKAAVEKYLKAWTEYQTTFLEALVVFPLEEVAVESLLQEAIRKNEFGPVTLYNKVNSAAYLSRSFDNGAADSLSKIGSLAKVNLELARRHDLQEWVAASENLIEKADRFFKEGEELKDKYARMIRLLQTSRGAGLVGDEPSGLHGTECEHMRSFRNELKKRGLRFP
ncbi:MAG TPA: hypothetical protein PL182_13980 [Pseudobdellovibrionaceae bacterium]|nr:hypothetical protein [Pseudobdellovibrionaceae bacterium]